MDKLKGARDWWTLTDQQCIVRLETVVNASVCCLIENNDNQLPKRLPWVSREAAEKGVWRVADEDHRWMMEESQRRRGICRCCI